MVPKKTVHDPETVLVVEEEEFFFFPIILVGMQLYGRYGHDIPTKGASPSPNPTAPNMYVVPAL
jgi:hypothetical protein